MNLWQDLRDAVAEADDAEKYFLMRQLLKQSENNKYGLLYNSAGEITGLGAIVGAFTELLWHDLYSIVDDRNLKKSEEKRGDVND